MTIKWPRFNCATAPPSIAELVFAGWECPIACGGVTLLPGDIVAGDEDGVIVIPRNLADEIVEAAEEQDRFERFVLYQVGRGAPVLGLYPPDEDALKVYQAWLDDGAPEA